MPTGCAGEEVDVGVDYDEVPETVEIVSASWWMDSIRSI